MKNISLESHNFPFSFAEERNCKYYSSKQKFRVWRRQTEKTMLRVPSRAFRLLPTSLPAGLTFDVAENKQQQLEAVEKLNEVVDWATNGGSDKAKELVELIFVCRNL